MKERMAELITATVHRNLDHNTTARRERHAQRLAEASLEPQEHLRTSAEKIRGTDSTKATMNKSEWFGGKCGSHFFALAMAAGVTVHCLTQYDETIMTFTPVGDRLLTKMSSFTPGASDCFLYWVNFNHFRSLVPSTRATE